jgi:hypothetical protein
MTVSPYLHFRDELIRQRERELRQRAARYGARTPGRAHRTRRAHRSARRRVGWALVRAGLALAGPPDEA